MEHHVVNHSISFVTDAGEHTNAVEGFNGLVKTRMRRFSNQLGHEDETMEGKVAAGVCHENFGLCGVLPLRGFECCSKVGETSRRSREWYVKLLFCERNFAKIYFFLLLL